MTLNRKGVMNDGINNEMGGGIRELLTALEIASMQAGHPLSPLCILPGG